MAKTLIKKEKFTWAQFKAFCSSPFDTQKDADDFLKIAKCFYQSFESYGDLRHVLRNVYSENGAASYTFSVERE